MNFFLNIWSISKTAVQRLNRLLRRFLWNKEKDIVVEVGWRWCLQLRENGGLGVPNIVAKGQALGAKWTFRTIASKDP